MIQLYLKKLIRWSYDKRWDKDYILKIKNKT